MYEENRYSQRIRITEEDLKWIKENKGEKSAAAFLEALINQTKERKERE